MSDVSLEQVKPHGKGPAIEPILTEYLREGNFTHGMNHVRSYADVRDLLVQCAAFVIRDREEALALPFVTVNERIVEMVQERTRVGIERYGEGLHADNGRDSGLDLLQELLDALQYSTQKITERT